MYPLNYGITSNNSGLVAEYKVLRQVQARELVAPIAERLSPTRGSNLVLEQVTLG